MFYRRRSLIPSKKKKNNSYNIYYCCYYDHIMIIDADVCWTCFCFFFVQKAVLIRLLSNVLSVMTIIIYNIIKKSKRRDTLLLIAPAAVHAL